MSKFRWREAHWMLCGAKIGEGAARKVYHCRTNVNYVVKIETRAQSFQNIAEFETWEWVQSGPLAKWFAPCEFISPCGLILMQRKVEPVRIAELPKRLPSFLCDLKSENFGIMDGRFVCCDYGTVPSSIKSASRKLVPARWRF